MTQKAQRIKFPITIPKSFIVDKEEREHYSMLLDKELIDELATLFLEMECVGFLDTVDNIRDEAHAILNKRSDNKATASNDDYILECRKLIDKEVHRHVELNKE